MQIKKLDDIVPDFSTRAAINRHLIATLPVIERMQVTVPNQHDLVEIGRDTLALQRAHHVVKLVPGKRRIKLAMDQKHRKERGIQILQVINRRPSPLSGRNIGRGREQISLAASNTFFCPCVKSLA
jgi:hypothetical protein